MRSPQDAARRNSEPNLLEELLATFPVEVRNEIERDMAQERAEQGGADIQRPVTPPWVSVPVIAHVPNNLEWVWPRAEPEPVLVGMPDGTLRVANWVITPEQRAWVEQEQVPSTPRARDRR